MVETMAGAIRMDQLVLVSVNYPLKGMKLKMPNSAKFALQSKRRIAVLKY